MLVNVYILVIVVVVVDDEWCAFHMTTQSHTIVETNNDIIELVT